jgi:quinol monooxygenase YgiN
MSMVVIGKFQGDTAKFRQALAERADEFVKIADAARSQGAIHHRFGIGHGFVMIIDEWETVEHFQQFFSNPDLQAFIATVGADPGPPEVTIAEAIDSADLF